MKQQDERVRLVPIYAGVCQLASLAVLLVNVHNFTVLSPCPLTSLCLSNFKQRTQPDEEEAEEADKEGDGEEDTFSWRITCCAVCRSQMRIVASAEPETSL